MSTQSFFKTISLLLCHWPVILYREYLQDHVEGPQQNPKPTARLPRRKRNLSITPQNSSSRSYTMDQSYSNFLSKLPIEIRMMIYEEVFGGMLVHLGLHFGDEFHRDYLRQYLCYLGDDKDEWYSHFRECWYERWSPKIGRPKAPDRKLLSLLQSCRQMCVSL